MKKGTKPAPSRPEMIAQAEGDDKRQVRPSILVVDDLPTNIQLLSAMLEKAGYVISGAPSAPIALEIARMNRPDLILLDVMMPGIDGFQFCQQLKEDQKLRDVPVIFLTARHESSDVIKGFEAGAVDYIVKPFRQEEVLVRVRTHLQIHFLNEDLLRKNEELQREISRANAAEEARKAADEKLQLFSDREEERWGIEGFIGRSRTLQKIFQDVQRLRNFDGTNVLITGESGTGKELVARALHFGSTRKGAFIPVNCAAIPAELAESSFFGHIRGAFTGAVADRKGVFELAEGGTLFLDEVGDMTLPLQSKLLRAIEDRFITPVGGREGRKINVRVVAATNADLPTKVANGAFREDLFYRLCGFSIQLPPLRERVEDIGLLASHLLAVFAREMGMPPPSIEPAALKKLESYSYPGNVRELKNLIERALIESDGRVIAPDHIILPRKGPENTIEADGPWNDLTGRGGNFWRMVSEPYLDRELSRACVRQLIDRGLSQTRGSYKDLVRLFGLEEAEYPKFMDFLRFHRLKPERPLPHERP
jgi:DNA-binding NtrC family response regulator